MRSRAWRFQKGLHWGRVAHGAAVLQQSQLLGGQGSKEGSKGLSSCQLWAADANLGSQRRRLTLQAESELLNAV